MPTAESIAPELTAELKKQGAEAVQKLNSEVGQLNKEINAANVELTRVQNQKKDEEGQIETLRAQKKTLVDEIAAEKLSQKEGLENFQAQMTKAGEKAETRITDAEAAEAKAHDAEQAHQEARSAHLSKVTETYDQAKALLVQAVALLNEIKKLASPEEQQGDQAPAEQPAA